MYAQGSIPAYSSEAVHNGIWLVLPHKNVKYLVNQINQNPALVPGRGLSYEVYSAGNW